MTIQSPASTLAIAAALVLSAVAPATSAQTAPAKTAAPAKPAAAAKKPTPAKASKKAPPAKVVAEPPPPPEAAGPDQIDAAERVYYGIYECEFKQTINIVASSKYPSYVDVKYAKFEYLMKPVLSSTGAIRLEDVRGEMLMVQVSSKSMVLNVKTGQRVVDDCISPKQRELVEAARVKAAAAVQAAAAAVQAAAASAAEAASASAPEPAAAATSAAPTGASAPSMTTMPTPLPTK